MPASGYFSLTDRSGERSAVSFLTGPVTALTIAGLLTQFGALRDAIEDITLGVVAEEAQYAFRTKLSNDLPASDYAQRELKWLVTYEDNQQFLDLVNAIENPGWRKIFNMEIPTADPALLPDGIGTDEVNITTSPMSDFVTAFEAIARSPYGGTVNVLKIQLVGRNL